MDMDLELKLRSELKNDTRQGNAPGGGPMVGRRGILKTAGMAVILGVSAVALPGRLLPASLGPTVHSLAGKKTPVASPRVKVDVPPYVYDGAVVPIEISVESPMTQADHVRRIHMVAEENPIPHVVSFTLSPANGLARVRTRIRLEQKQMVVVLAEMSDGRILMHQVEVDVAIGGCTK